MPGSFVGLDVWLVAWLVGRTDGLAGRDYRLICLLGWMLICFAWFNGLVVGWLVGWLVVWLVGWLVMGLFFGWMHGLSGFLGFVC